MRRFNTAILLIGLIFAALLENAQVAQSEIVEIKSAPWELMTASFQVNCFLLSDSQEVLWVGTMGGIEERDTISGEFIKQYTTLNGLPNNQVRKMATDYQGGFWAGTELGGLAHYRKDGSWKIFNTANSDLPCDTISGLMSDHDGGIWISVGLCGSDQETGIIHLDTSGTFGPLYRPETITCITCLTGDLEGGIWFGYPGGVGHLNSNGETDILETFDAAGNSRVFKITNRLSGGIWIATEGSGLFFRDREGRYQHYHTGNSNLLSNQVWDLVCDSNGGLWVGTLAGLSHLNAYDHWKVIDRNSVTALEKNGTDGFWVGQVDSYVFRDTDGYAVKSHELMNLKLLNSSITTLASDHQGNLWVGTGISAGRGKGDSSGRGISIIRPDGSYATVQYPSGVDEYYGDYDIYTRRDFISAFFSDANQGMWVGIHGRGMTYYKDQKMMQLYRLGELEDFFKTRYPISVDLRDWVSGICSDGNDGIWVGTYGNGLNHYVFENNYADAHLENFRTDNSELPGNVIHSLIEDGEGGVWIGTAQGGLSHFMSDREWKNYNTHNSRLPHDWVTAIRLDQENGVWIGTGGGKCGDRSWGGVVHLTGDDHWEIYNTENSSIPKNFISDIFIDSRKRVWIGTTGLSMVLEAQSPMESYFDIVGKGIAFLDSHGQWQVFNQDNSGLSSNYVNAILSDGSGGLWIGTDYGGLSHLMLLGSPDAVGDEDGNIILNWFLNYSLLKYKKVNYIELQRSLVRNGPYETVRDDSGNPIRFEVDYEECFSPRTSLCQPKVSYHTPARLGDTGHEVIGYSLNEPVVDSEWLEGMPRYYRLSAVLEESGQLIRAVNNQEATWVEPLIKEKPRVQIVLEKTSLALSPGDLIRMSVFVTSLDLFSGNVAFVIEASEGFAVKLRPAQFTLSPGVQKCAVLTIQAPPDDMTLPEDTLIRIVPKTALGVQNSGAALNLLLSQGTEIALGIDAVKNSFRVMEGISISGNLMPPQAQKEIVISGNMIQSITVRTDANGFFEGLIVPQSSGLLEIRATDDLLVSKPVKASILPAISNMTLTSNVSPDTQKGDVLNLKGIISPIRTTAAKVFLDIRYLDPTVPENNWAPQFIGNVRLDEKGVFTKKIIVPDLGFIMVKASLAETSDFLGAQTELMVPVGQPVGEAIVIVSEVGSDTYQDISTYLGRYVYDALTKRHIPSDRIRYLGSAVPSITSHGNAGKENLRSALLDWAVPLMSMDDPYKTPLNLYFIGRIEENLFLLNDEEQLSAEALQSYLIEAEQAIKKRSPNCIGFPVTILLEGQQSGTFLENISGNGRVVLTSSSRDSIDRGGYAGYDGDGYYSFSKSFYEHITYGYTIDASFAQAEYEILKFYNHIQRPLMDVDGDGLANTDLDRNMGGRNLFIEHRQSGNLRPEIRGYSKLRTIDGNVTSDLYAIAVDPENDIEGVYCSIIDPSGQATQIRLEHTEGKMFRKKYANYFQHGIYHHIYYAKDNAGNVSLPRKQSVNVVTPLCPSPPELIIESIQNKVSISWKSAGAEGYQLYYAPYPGMENFNYIDLGNLTNLTFEASGMAFYIAVVAYNTAGSSHFSVLQYFDL